MAPVPVSVVVAAAEVDLGSHGVSDDGGEGDGVAVGATERGTEEGAGFDLA